jgi:chromosome segregation protein
LSARLKSLTLQGFKTFVQRTQLELDAGITAVVGPNGSGKSNLADGVRWALGEQSLRAIRGRRTEDVLFSGGNGRPPAGFAEVAVTFESNLNGLNQPEPPAFAELNIARRAYRSGENEYFVNREKVRLKDVVDLYGQLGLGSDGFALVGQGEVDAALSVRAEDRRELIAQAAGLGHLQGRLAESLAKLNFTEQNLARASDLVEELTPRLRGLERQARQAREREAIQDEFSRGLVRWYASRWLGPWTSQREAATALAHAEQVSCELVRERADLSRALEEAERQLAVASDRLDQARRRLEELTTARDAVRRSVAANADGSTAIRRRMAEELANASHW